MEQVRALLVLLGAFLKNGKSVARRDLSLLAKARQDKGKIKRQMKPYWGGKNTNMRASKLPTSASLKLLTHSTKKRKRKEEERR